MSSRKDGKVTREKILEAACHVFGEKGYRDSTNKDICQKANANIAAINYHFGSKADLYRACMRHAMAKADQLYPRHGNIPETAASEDRLRGIITSLVFRHMDCDQLGHLHRIRMTEQFSPTGLLDDLMVEIVQKTRNYLTTIIQELLGPKAMNRDISLCEMSVISQCLMRSRKKGSDEFRVAMGIMEHSAEVLADHIFRFSLAGIEAVRKRINHR